MGMAVGCTLMAVFVAWDLWQTLARRAARAALPGHGVTRCWPDCTLFGVVLSSPSALAGVPLMFALLITTVGMIMV